MARSSKKSLGRKPTKAPMTAMRLLKPLRDYLEGEKNRTGLTLVAIVEQLLTLRRALQDVKAGSEMERVLIENFLLKIRT